MTYYPYYIADLIGQHALLFITSLSILALIGVILVWSLFEKYYRRLWQAGVSLWDRIRTLPIIDKLRHSNPRLWLFFKNHLSPRGYLALHLTIGFIVAVMALSAFNGVAEHIVESGPLVRFDQRLATALYQNTTAPEALLFRVVTNFAGRAATIGVGIGVGLWLVIRKKKLLLASWIVALAGNSLLNGVLKLTFQRARPSFDDPLLVENFYSFPSGHAMGSIVIYGMLTYILAVTLIDTAWKKMILISLTILIIFFIGFSRMYLGVHYFSDILAGYAAGTGWLAIVITGTEITRRREKRRRLHPVRNPAQTNLSSS